MEKMPDGSKVYRNEKQEEKINIKNQIEQFSKYESNIDRESEDYNRTVSDKNKQTGQPVRQAVRRDLTQILKLRVSDANPNGNVNKEKMSNFLSIYLLFIVWMFYFFVYF
jgi:hypothetical protein